MAFKDYNRLNGTTQKMPFRKIGGDAFRPIIFEGKDMRTAIGSYYPNRWLPTLRVRSKHWASNSMFHPGGEEKHWFVMPIGTIVSTLNIPTAVAGTGYSNVVSGINASGAGTTLPGDYVGHFGIGIDGQLVITRDADGTSGAITVDANNQWYGYPEEITGLFTICNGFDDPVQDTYTSYDADAEFLDAEGNIVSAGDVVVDAAGNDAPRPARCRPAGIVILDVYKDIEGRWMNFSQPGQKGYAIANSAKIVIPFVKDASDGSNGTNYNVSERTGSMPDTVPGVGYNSVMGDYPFLYWDVDSGAGITVAEVQSNHNYTGEWLPDGYRNEIILTSDDYGKFKPITSAEYTNYPWMKVGRLVALDTMFPKSMMEYVDTYPDSQTQGTDTEGIPTILYEFVRRILAANGMSTGRSDIREAIQRGDFGLARIEVQIGI